MDEPCYYRSTTAAMELEAVPAEEGVWLHLFPREEHAKGWNGLALDKQTVRRLVDDLSAWLNDAVD